MTSESYSELLVILVLSNLRVAVREEAVAIAPATCVAAAVAEDTFTETQKKNGYRILTCIGLQPELRGQRPARVGNLAWPRYS